jgi:hypothetical protein
MAGIAWMVLSLALNMCAREHKARKQLHHAYSVQPVCTTMATQFGSMATQDMCSSVVGKAAMQALSYFNAATLLPMTLNNKSSCKPRSHTKLQ